MPGQLDSVAAAVANAAEWRLKPNFAKNDDGKLVHAPPPADEIPAEPAPGSKKKAKRT